MTLKECHKVVQEKGGTILEHRTTMKGLNVGDTFSMQTLCGPYEILFFFKDPIFDYIPMVFGLCKKTNTVLMVSSKLITIIEQDLKTVKRKRRN